jgi:hypothetical protein
MSLVTLPWYCTKVLSLPVGATLSLSVGAMVAWACSLARSFSAVRRLPIEYFQPIPPTPSIISPSCSLRRPAEFTLLTPPHTFFTRIYSPLLRIVRLISKLSIYSVHYSRLHLVPAFIFSSFFSRLFTLRTATQPAHNSFLLYLALSILVFGLDSLPLVTPKGRLT